MRLQGIRNFLPYVITSLLLVMAGCGAYTYGRQHAETSLQQVETEKKDLDSLQAIKCAPREYGELVVHEFRALEELEEKDYGEASLEASEALTRLNAIRSALSLKAECDDYDGDGLANSVDSCPSAAEDRDGFEDEDGCPDRDDDHDGVPDLKDRCSRSAETPNGIRDDDGCPDERFILKERFPSGQSSPPEAMRSELRQFYNQHIRVVKDRVRIDFAAYGDLLDDSAGDQLLARNRAQAVRLFFEKQGISIGRMPTQRYRLKEIEGDPQKMRGAVQMDVSTFNEPLGE